VSGNPRKDPQAAYEAFMGMSDDEWSGLIGSLLRGGVLEPAEMKGFVRASEERRRA
jgi:hypothetical protein